MAGNLTRAIQALPDTIRAEDRGDMRAWGIIDSGKQLTLPDFLMLFCEGKDHFSRL